MFILYSDFKITSTINTLKNALHTFLSRVQILKYYQSSRDSTAKWTFQPGQCKSTLLSAHKPGGCQSTVLYLRSELLYLDVFCRSLRENSAGLSSPPSPLPALRSHSLSFTISLLPFFHRNKHHIFGSLCDEARSYNYRFSEACQGCCRLFQSAAMSICWQPLAMQRRIDLLLVCSSAFA